MDLTQELAALRAEMAELRAMARDSAAQLAIGRLQHAYGYYVDKGLWDEAADLFAADGTLEIAGRGVYIGRERVRRYLHALPAYGRGVLFNHMQLQPVLHIDVKAGTAKARWRTFIQLGFLGGVARWGEAVYENRYVARDGVWRIAALHGFITYYTEFDQGWNKGGVPLLRSVDGLEPDAPPTIAYEAYPEAFVPPFHYPNPVTGRSR